MLLQIEDSVHDVKEEVIQVKERQVAFPSILYQVIKIPQMGWPLLLAVLLIMWLVSRLGSEGIGALAAYFGIEAAPETGVVILIGALGFVSMLGYTKYLNNKGEQK